MPQQKPYLLFAGQGGAAWGAYPAGALLEYFEQGEQAYDGGFGVSVNALNVSQLMASTNRTIPDQQQQLANVRRLKNLWWSVQKNEHIYKAWKPSGAVTYGVSQLGLPKLITASAIALLRKRPAIYNTRPLWKMIQRELNGYKWHPSVHVGVVSMETGRLQEVSLARSGKLTPLEAIYASTAIPVFFPATKGFYDGGATDQTPLKKVFEQFRDQRKQNPKQRQELHVYRCTAWPVPKPDRYDRLDKVPTRTLDILIANADREDFERAEFINKLSRLVDRVMASNDTGLKRAFRTLHEKYSRIDIYVIGPSRRDMQHFPKDAKTFNRKYIKAGFDLGRKRMQDFLRNKSKYRLENVLP